MLVSLVLAPVLSFNSPFSVSPPPATLAVRGRVLTVVCLVIALFSSRLPRHAGVTRHVFDGWFALLLCLRFPRLLFFAFYLAS